MNTIQKGEIEVDSVNGNNIWGSKKLVAERSQGSVIIVLTIPLGPRTKDVVRISVNKNELNRLIGWMKGETR